MEGLGATSAWPASSARGWVLGGIGGCGKVLVGAISCFEPVPPLSLDKGRGIHPLRHDVGHSPQLDPDHHEARSPHHGSRCNKVKGGVWQPLQCLVCCAGVTLPLCPFFPLSEPVRSWKPRLFLTSLSLGLIWIRFVGMLIG